MVEEQIQAPATKVQTTIFVPITFDKLKDAVTKICGNEQTAQKAIETLSQVLRSKTNKPDFTKFEPAVASYLQAAYNVIKQEYKWPPVATTSYALSTSLLNKVSNDAIQILNQSMKASALFSQGTRMDMLLTLRDINKGDVVLARQQMAALENAIRNRNNVPDFSMFDNKTQAYLSAVFNASVNKIEGAPQPVQISFSQDDLASINKNAKVERKEKKAENYNTRFVINLKNGWQYVYEVPKMLTASVRNAIAEGIRNGKGVAELNLVFGNIDAKLYRVGGKGTPGDTALQIASQEIGISKITISVVPKKKATRA